MFISLQKRKRGPAHRSLEKQLYTEQKNRKKMVYHLKNYCLVGINLHSCNHVKQRPSPTD